jgi:small ligand-binding sensory domain FIST
MPFSAAISRHPAAADAVGEIVGSVLENIGPAPDLAVLFGTESHVESFEAIADGVRTLLEPGVLIGATASSVIGGDREIESQPALSLWAARLDPVTPVRLDAVQTSDGWFIAGLPDEVDGGDRVLLLLPDPFSFPADVFLAELARRPAAPLVLGGLASAARAPGGNRLVLDDVVHDDGAVGVLLAREQIVTPVVSQGCRPIGEPYVVTRAERNIILELGGRPALDRLRDIVTALDVEDQVLVQHGLQIGCVVDESKEVFDRGDFLIRNVLGADQEAGAVAVGEMVDVGATVQFQVRDASSADRDLRDLIAGQQADGALLFTCNGRGLHLFGEPDHDASIVDAAVTGGATAGMFCAGELGPVGGRSFLHGFTASVALFRDP